MFNFDTNYLLVSMVWGTVGSGYFLYGKKQAAAAPLVGGILLVVASTLISSTLTLSLVSIGTIGAIHWLLRRGY